MIMLDGAKRGISNSLGYSKPNVEKLVGFVSQLPGCTEISLEFMFTSSDFDESVTALKWTHHLPAVINEAIYDGKVRAVPTSFPPYRAFYPCEKNV